MNYSKMIKKLRERLIMTRQEFAEYVGASYISVYRLENGKCKLTIKMRRQLAELFKKENIEEIYE